MTESLLHLLGGFAGVVTGPLALVGVLLAGVALTSPWLVRGTAALIALAAMALELWPPELARWPELAGAIAGGLVLAEAWLGLVLPALRQVRRACLAAARLGLALWQAARAPAAPPPRPEAD